MAVWILMDSAKRLRCSRIDFGRRLFGHKKTAPTGALFFYVFKFSLSSCLQQGFSDVNSGSRVCGVAVGTDLVGVALGYGSAANHDFGIDAGPF